MVALNASTVRHQDALIGPAIRAQRNLAGISEDQLAAALGVHRLQVRHIEEGMVRLSAGQLWVAARVVGLASVDPLFEEPPASADIFSDPFA